jgi:hypothetical protein
MRSPKRGEVWVHVDRIDREDGRVWAVQWRGSKGGPYYQTAHKVEFLSIARTFSKFFGRRSKLEPRLVIIVPRGEVKMIDLASNMRVAQITTATSSGVDKKRRARV